MKSSIILCLPLCPPLSYLLSFFVCHLQFRLQPETVQLDLVYRTLTILSRVLLHAVDVKHMLTTSFYHMEVLQLGTTLGKSFLYYVCSRIVSILAYWTNWTQLFPGNSLQNSANDPPKKSSKAVEDIRQIHFEMRHHDSNPHKQQTKMHPKRAQFLSQEAITQEYQVQIARKNSNRQKENNDHKIHIVVLSKHSLLFVFYRHLQHYFKFYVLFINIVPVQ